MATFDFNFSDVPSENKPIEPGVYEMTIDEITHEPTRNDPTRFKFVIQHTIINHSELEGKQFSNVASAQAPGGRITMKRLALSAGLTEDQLASLQTTDPLIGKVVKAVVKKREYRDPQTNEVRQTTDLDTYLIPGDSGY